MEDALTSARFLGCPIAPDTDPTAAGSLHAVSAQLRELLIAELAGPASARLALLCKTVLELADLESELRLERLQRRSASMDQVRRAIARLHELAKVSDLLDRAPVLLCEVCGFDRAMLIRLEGPRAVLHRLHFPLEPEREERVLDYSRRTLPRLDHFLIEAEAVRHGGPILVPDTSAEPRVHAGLLEQIGSRGYVAAPIMSGERAFGLLHADYLYTKRVPDEVDRDQIWAFAESFGYLLERASLLARLHAQRDQIRALLHSTAAAISGYTDPEVIFSGTEAGGEEATPAMAPLARLPGPPPGELEGLLTRRELEVLKLLVVGAQNRRIADQLVISPGTVKSHVAQILRKLGASNRSQAVARYLGPDE